MEKKSEEKVKKNLSQKLFEIKEEISIMKKNQEGHGYTFVDEESLLLKINNKMRELNLRLIPNFVPGTMKLDTINYKNAKGQDKTDILVSCEMKYTWSDIETGEKEINDWIMVGQQADGSQAMGSGLTYSNRYFLLKYFNVATSQDDPDAIRSKMAKEEEQKKISPVQTKVKSLFAKMVKKYQDKDKIYGMLGITKEEFIQDYNIPEKCSKLLEQMELIEKDKGEQNA